MVSEESKSNSIFLLGDDSEVAEGDEVREVICLEEATGEGEEDRARGVMARCGSSCSADTDMSSTSDGDSD